MYEGPGAKLKRRVSSGWGGDVVSDQVPVEVNLVEVIDQRFSSNKIAVRFPTFGSSGVSQVVSRVSQMEYLMECLRWSISGGVSQVEYLRWSIPGGVSQVEYSRWSISGRVSQVEYLRWRILGIVYLLLVGEGMLSQTKFRVEMKSGGSC